MPDPTLLPKRIREHVEINTSTGCWEWTAGRTRSGYGVCRGTSAHRVVYGLLIAEVPSDLALDHLCRVRLCVNPDHLEPVTVAENNRRSNELITHCPAGHEYTEANTSVNPSGARVCRQCRRDRDTARRRAAGAPERRPGWCRSGQHELVPENTYTTSQGRTGCLACRREYDREWQRARRATA